MSVRIDRYDQPRLPRSERLSESVSTQNTSSVGERVRRRFEGPAVRWRKAKNAKQWCRWRRGVRAVVGERKLKRSRGECVGERWGQDGEDGSRRSLLGVNA